MTDDPALSGCQASTQGGEATADTVTLDLEMLDGLAPEETLRRAKRSLRVGEAAARVTAHYLAELADDQVYLALGHPSLAHCFEHRFQEPPGTLYEYVSVGRALRELRDLDAALAEGRVSWSVVKLLIRVVIPETQAAWIEWATGRTWRQVKNQVARRAKGDLPATTERRTIHHVTLPVNARLTTTEYEVWRRARAKLEAETGRPISVRQLLLEAARLVLTTRPDGSVPGRTPVQDRHYLIHAAPRSPTQPELVTDGEDGDLVPLDLAELTGYGLVKVAAGVPALEADPLVDPRNSGPVLPEAERAAPTSPALRAEVLYRDGHRCKSCGSRRNLSCHHLHWRSYGGPTTAENLLTLCEDCHSLVHARLLVILGDLSGELRFLDRDGGPRDVVAPPQRLRWSIATGPTAGARPRDPVLLRTLPAEVDGEWWARHQQLFSWNDRQGELALRGGFTDEAPPACAPPAGEPPARRLEGLVGQDRLRERLSVSIAASRRQAEQLPHLLFTGAAGLGKTHLAEAVAGELGAALVRLPAPLVRAPDVLLRALASLPSGAVLFMDELHALPRRAAEVLYEALDAGALSLPVRQGLELRTLRLRLRPFTLIGATTDEDRVPGPLLSRLGCERLEFPTASDLGTILLQAARERGLELTVGARSRLAAAARDTPRRGLQLLRAVRDQAALAGASVIEPELVERVLEREGVDRSGCTRLDRAYLDALRVAGRPIGLRALAARLGAGERAIRETCEPFLLRRGLIRITPRGRELVARPARRRAG